MKRESSWIIQTGQAWKIYVAVVGFSGALACFTLGFFSLGGNEGKFLGLMACGTMLLVATFAWFTIALRCPHCLAKLVWTMAMSRPHSSWVIDLAGLESCPLCHHSLVNGGT